MKYTYRLRVPHPGKKQSERVQRRSCGCRCDFWWISKKQAEVVQYVHGGRSISTDSPCISIQVHTCTYIVRCIHNISLVIHGSHFDPAFGFPLYAFSCRTLHGYLSRCTGVSRGYRDRKLSLHSLICSTPGKWLLSVSHADLSTAYVLRLHSGDTCPPLLARHEGMRSGSRQAGFCLLVLSDLGAPCVTTRRRILLGAAASPAGFSRRPKLEGRHPPRSPPPPQHP